VSDPTNTPPAASRPTSEYAFGWAHHWTNAVGDPMVTVPLAMFEALTTVADDALALLDQHISEEQRRELGIRTIERMTFLGRLT
jgi:hypothetical protein